MIDGVIEAFAEFLNGVKGRINLSALNKAYLTKVQTGLFGQFFLCQTLLETGMPYVAAENF